MLFCNRLSLCCTMRKAGACSLHCPWQRQQHANRVVGVNITNDRLFQRPACVTARRMTNLNPITICSRVLTEALVASHWCLSRSKLFFYLKFDCSFGFAQFRKPPVLCGPVDTIRAPVSRNRDSATEAVSWRIRFQWCTPNSDPEAVATRRLVYLLWSFQMRYFGCPQISGVERPQETLAISAPLCSAHSKASRVQFVRSFLS